MYCADVMNSLISLSELNGNLVDIPIFACIAINDRIVSISQNQVEKFNACWLHAEFIVIQDSCSKLGVRYLDNASLYVNLEPCVFCASLIEKVRIKEVFYGAYDKKCGAIEHNLKIFDQSESKPLIIGGIQEQRCSKIVSGFFNKLRK